MFQNYSQLWKLLVEFEQVRQESWLCVEYAGVLDLFKFIAVQIKSAITVDASDGISPCKLRTMSSCCMASNTG